MSLLQLLIPCFILHLADRHNCSSPKHRLRHSANKAEVCKLEEAPPDRKQLVLAISTATKKTCD